MSHSGRPAMSRRSFLASTAGVSLVALHPFSARAAAGQAHLRIMETTDLHVHVWPYDYYSDKPVDTVGLARTAAHIADIRAEATNALLLDNGDFLQGNPMGDYIAYERGMKDGDMHPVITAMNTVGFDASTLGNHEFNYGLDFLMKSLAGANFPVVSANVVRERGASPTADTTLVKPYVILDRELTDGAGEKHPIRIGLIGFVPPQIMNWDRKHLEGNVTARDILETARAYVPQMREEGADIIDVGAESTRPGAAPLSIDEELSRALPVIEGLAGKTRALISIDTRNAATMRAAAAAGADMINDVSALTHDPDALATVAESGLAVVLMHAQGDPRTMQDDPQYEDVLLDVFDYLEARVDACTRAGISRSRLIVDPGLGFGKTVQHNLELMAGLSLFHGLGVPVLLGASRKSFVGRISGVKQAGERIMGSVGAALAAAVQGAQIIRVHDVAATRQALAVWMAANEGKAPDGT